jgi:hypothetical protein
LSSAAKSLYIGIDSFSVDDAGTDVCTHAFDLLALPLAIVDHSKLFASVIHAFGKYKYACAFANTELLLIKNCLVIVVVAPFHNEYFGIARSMRYGILTFFHIVQQAVVKSDTGSTRECCFRVCLHPAVTLGLHPQLENNSLHA